MGNEISTIEANPEMESNKGLAVSEKQRNFSNILADKDQFELAKSLAGNLANSFVVPEHYKKNPFDIIIALYQSSRMSLEPLEFMANTYPLNGKISFYTKYAISLANIRGPFEGRIKFKTQGEGDELKVKAYAKLDGEEISAVTSLKMAKAEGWTRNTKYNSMPEHMLHFRSASMLINRYCPEVLGGIAMEQDDSPIVIKPDTQSDQDKLLRGNG